MAGDLIPNVSSLNPTIEFLTAMVTPTLLISATGSLVLSTSTRLGRVVDRVRELEQRLSDLITIDDKEKEHIPLYEKRLDTVVNLLDKVTTRSRILQKAMSAFYYGLGFFILTSVTIAIAGIFNIYRGTPIFVGVVGICFLFYGSILMLLETRMATATVNAEMDFTWALANTVAPKEIINKYIYNAKGKRRLRRKVLETLEDGRTEKES
jgi:hypothetical protein